MIKEQETLNNELTKVIEIFRASQGEIRPHFILTGASGTGKSYMINALAEKMDIEYLEINAAQLTKEGTSGNSLSKALAPLVNKQQRLTICFVDEFDKLFISGNSNESLAHESTNGVQNEFLKVLESDHSSVFGDYGKYVSVLTKNVMFIFAGAFNGEENITIDRLRDFGVKTEFLGRVGLVFNAQTISIESLIEILKQSEILDGYLKLFSSVDKCKVVDFISGHLTKNYEKNTLGIRLINTLVHQYFIKGGKLGDDEVKSVVFKKHLTFNK